MSLQDLPPEVVYQVLKYLSSNDITTVASMVDCQALRKLAMVLLNERAQQSMTQGWRIILCASISKPESEGGQLVLEDKEFVCEYEYIDQETSDIYFSAQAFGEEGYCSYVDDSLNNNFSALSIKPPLHSCTAECSVDKGSILLPFESSSISIQTGILKEKVPTKLLEYAVTLPSDYSFTVTPQDYEDLDPGSSVSLAATLDSQFIVHYRVQRLLHPEPTPEPQEHMYIPSETTLPPPIPQHPEYDIIDITPPLTARPPSEHAVIPDIAIQLQSIQITPDWWWHQLKRQEQPSFIGLEHKFW